MHPPAPDPLTLTADELSARLADGDRRLAGLVLADQTLLNLDLRAADLRHAALTTLDLRGADLSGADLTRATLAGVSLRGGTLPRVKLAGATLRDHLGLPRPANRFARHVPRAAAE